MASAGGIRLARTEISPGRDLQILRAISSRPWSREGNATAHGRIATTGVIHQYTTCGIQAASIARAN